MNGGQVALSADRTQNLQMNRSETGRRTSPAPCRWVRPTLAKACRAPAAPRLVLGRYRLEQRLGAGGFGVVWQAWDEKLERDVAVKVIPRERRRRTRGWSARRWRPRASTTRGSWPSTSWRPTSTTSTWCPSSCAGANAGRAARAPARSSDRDVARIGAALCDALEHAHARGVIHRDVKPQNVMVLAEPAAGAGFAKLTDFGVAHLASGDPLTRTGDVVGTLAYMAPEQAEGARVTPACDVYSLALTLYEAWTGANPVRAGGPGRHRAPARAARCRRSRSSGATCRPSSATRSTTRSTPTPAARPPPGELRAELRAAERELSDEGGLVEPETLRALRPATSRRRRRARERCRPLRAAGRAETPAGAEERGSAGAACRRAEPRAWPARGAGLLAGALGFASARRWPGAALLALVRRRWPPWPSRCCRASAGCCPRSACCGWLASPEADRQGTALVLAAALLPVPLSCSRARACSGRCPRWRRCWARSRSRPRSWAWRRWPPPRWRRAGLAAAGFLWLAARRGAHRRAAALRRARRHAAARRWEGSIVGAASDALVAADRRRPPSPRLLVWAAFAVAAPASSSAAAGWRWTWRPAGAWAAALVPPTWRSGDLLAATTALDQRPRAPWRAPLGRALVGLSRCPRSRLPRGLAGARDHG